MCRQNHGRRNDLHDRLIILTKDQHAQRSLDLNQKLHQLDPERARDKSNND